MKTKRIKRKIHKRLRYSNITKATLLEQLSISDEKLNVFLSGETLFEDPTYHQFLDIIGLESNEIGYYLEKTEDVYRHPLTLWIPKKQTFQCLIRAIKQIFAKSKSKLSKQEKRTILANDLFGHKTIHKPFYYRTFFFLILAIYFFNLALSHITILSILLPSALFPITILLFLYEIDRSNISLKQILWMFLIGGLASIGLTYMIREITGYPEHFFGDVVTGLVEEGAKIIIAIIIIKIVKVRTMFSGLLIGFAVGAGFDVFETTDYAIQSLFIPSESMNDMHITTWVRSIFSIGIGHHFWTGMITAAYVGLNKTSKTKILTVLHPWFLMVFVLVTMFHALWNNGTINYPIIQALLGIIIFFFFATNAYIFSYQSLSKQQSYSNDTDKVVIL